LVKFLNIVIILFVIYLNSVTEADYKETYSEIRSWYKRNENYPVSFYPDQNHLIKEQSILQIILIRHGNPRIKKKNWYSYKEAFNYIYTYDTVGVYDFDVPPVEIRSDETVEIYSSPLNRAYDTARKTFGESNEIKIDSTFIEFQREIVPLPLVLPINGWTSLSRFFWMIGLHSDDIPSFRSERNRAKSGGNILEMAASENNKIILVAHGFLNKYIVKYLKENGWDHSYQGGNDYLAVQVLTKIQAQ
jgi:hypothetical protein